MIVGLRAKVDFYTAVLRKSSKFWVSLCLENGLVGQGRTKEESLTKLKEAIGSFLDAGKEDAGIASRPVSIGELHEFLAVEGSGPKSEPFELRAIHA
jgi:predicted RNase H-like HicB family nuclease